MKKIAYISGHLDLREDEFEEHYHHIITEYIKDGYSFVVGDARGADYLAQRFLFGCGDVDVTVYHMHARPRHNVGSFSCVGGFMSDETRDHAMTMASAVDIAWIRPGREKSGTAANLKRRHELENNKHPKSSEYKDSLMSTGYVIEIGYISGYSTNHDEEGAWGIMETYARKIIETPSIIESEVLRIIESLDIGDDPPSVMEVCETYKLSPMSGGPCTIDSTKRRISITCSGGNQARKVKETVARAFCRLITEYMHHFNIDVSTTVH